MGAEGSEAMGDMMRVLADGWVMGGDQAGREKREEGGKRHEEKETRTSTTSSLLPAHRPSPIADTRPAVPISDHRPAPSEWPHRGTRR